MTTKFYEFPITIMGTGENVNEAWLNAIENLSVDPGEPPEKFTTTEEEESEEE